jgi:hypothetical protein
MALDFARRLVLEEEQRISEFAAPMLQNQGPS